MAEAIKIIIVDDHQMFIDGVKALLIDVKNIQIIDEATNGNALLQKLETQRPDIILMDIGMNELNGIEATKIISEKHPAIKVIALTMYDDHTRIAKMLQSGVKGYILKNTSKTELIEAINAVAVGEVYYSKQVMNVVMNQSTKPAQNEISLLTKREIEIIKLIVKSMTSKEIATKLSLSELTVNTHRKNAMQKLNARNAAALVKFALDNNIAEL